MQQYLMSVYYTGDDAATDPAELEQTFADVDVYNTKLQDAGAWVFAGGLHEPDVATVVEAKDGDFLVTDGPFPEGKEQIGGFWIINAENLDAALDWAREASAACRGPVEVRPFQDGPEV